MITREFCNAVLVLNGLFLRVKKIAKSRNIYTFTLTLDKKIFCYMKLNCYNKKLRVYADKSLEYIVAEKTLPYHPDIKGYFEWIIEQISLDNLRSA